MNAVGLFIYFAQKESVPIYYLGAAVAYIMNLVESCQWSFTDKYLKNQRGLTETKKIIEQCKQRGPKITWTIQNYGYQEVVTTEKDANGSDIEKKTKVRVKTHYA